MAVYVDRLMWNGWRLNGRVIMSCHMIADDMEELHRFARRIGLRREWLHDSTACPHYDLTPGKRFEAVRQGVVQLEREEFVVKMRAIRERLRAQGYWEGRLPSRPAKPSSGSRQRPLF